MADTKTTDNPDIYLEAKDVWEYANKNRTELSKKMALIAENEERGYQIYLTIEEHGYPFISVFYTADDETPVEEEPVVTAVDCQNAVERLYRKYLYTPQKIITGGDEDMIPTLSKSEEEIMTALSRAEAEDEIEDRENALYGAFMDFMSVVLEVDMGEMAGVPEVENDLNEMMDRFLEMVNNDYGISVRRPMLLVESGGNDGEEFFAEYPYDEGYSCYPT